MQELFGPLNPPVLGPFFWHGHISLEAVEKIRNNQRRFVRNRTRGRALCIIRPSSKLHWTMADVDEKQVKNSNSARGTTGRVLHSPALYDVLAWLFMRGHEGVFREKLVDLARLRAGETVLDVACGTGTLAIAAKRRVGPSGSVHGIDASPEMIARATKKARTCGVEVVFTNAIVEALPYPEAHFDAVLSTLMLHHLPRNARQQCAREMRRVLKPGGRVLAVDFGEPHVKRGGLLSHLHRHGHVALRDIIEVLSDAGLSVVESGAVGIKDLQFVLATIPVSQVTGVPANRGNR